MREKNIPTRPFACEYLRRFRVKTAEFGLALTGTGVDIHPFFDDLR